MRPRLPYDEPKTDSHLREGSTLSGDPYKALEKFLNASHELALQEGTLQERLGYVVNEFVIPTQEEDLPWDVVDTFQQLRKETTSAAGDKLTAATSGMSADEARKHVAAILTITSELELQLSRV